MRYDMLDIKLQFGILLCSLVYSQYHFKYRVLRRRGSNHRAAVPAGELD